MDKFLLSISLLPGVGRLIILWKDQILMVCSYIIQGVPFSNYPFIAFLTLLDNIERRVSSNPESIRSTREALFKLISRMDALESSFDRIVERSRKCQDKF